MSRAAALLVAYALATSGCASYHLMRAGQVNTNAAGRVQAKLVATRGLTFQSPVPLQAVPAAEARTMLERELHAQYSSDELAKLSRIYGALGLIPPGTDLERAYLDLYGQQIAGFYDPLDRRMVLVEDAITPDLLTRMVEGVLRRDFAGELVLAHELTHALQDQHYGLDVGRNDLGEDDAELARHAVYEGDATLAGFAVVLGTLKPSAAVSLAGKLEGVPDALARAYPDIPDAVRATVAFQYVAGANFVSWAYQRAGWDGVNALLAHPPFSTEQILHPEKYFVRAEYPLGVRVGGIAPYLPAGWQVAEEATLGEFTIQVLGNQFLAHDRAQTMAAGWSGDRMVALSHGDDLAIVWLSAWDTEQDAAEFFAGYGAILAAKHPGAAAATSADTVLTSQGPSPYRVERRETKVLVVEGPLDRDLARVTERVWLHSTYQQTIPAVPVDLAACDGRRPRK
ncbi:MAG: hypothetical protein HY271_09960 [Deltaproteobacteria bacterium]|nr:hypothetical protein [Deltaproteobacteria bacterium]